MRIQRWQAWFWVVSWSFAGCLSGDEVLLGSAQLQKGENDAGANVGAGAEPTAKAGGRASPPAGFPPPTSLVEVAESGRCDVPATGQLTVELRVDDLGECPSNTCTPGYPQLMSLLDDGSAWLLVDVASPSSPALSDHVTRLVHVDARGAVFASTQVAGYADAFTVDDRGIVWLLRGEPASTALQRFDSSANELGQPLAAPSGASAIAAVAGRGVVLANGGAHPVVTLLDYAGNPVWSRQGVEAVDQVALAVGPRSVALLHGVSREVSYVGIGVQAYTFAGDPVWEGESSVNLTSVGFVNEFSYGVDYASNLILAVTPPNPAGGLELTGVIDVESLDADGATRWALRLPSSSVLPAMAVAADGAVWVSQGADASASNPDPLSGSVARLSQAGASCQRFTYRGMRDLSRLQFAPDGRLCFLDELRRFGCFTKPAP